MTPQAVIRSILIADADIAAIVADRVRPVTGAQGETRPFLTTSITANQATVTHSGAAGSANASLEIGILADTYADADALAGHLRRVLNGYSGTIDDPDGGNSVRIAPCVYDEESDVEQTTAPGQSNPVYLKTVSFRVRYLNRPAPTGV